MVGGLTRPSLFPTAVEESDGGGGGGGSNGFGRGVDLGCLGVEKDCFNAMREC